MFPQWIPNVVQGWELKLPPPTGRKKRWLSLNDRNHWSRSSPLTRYWREVGYEKACELAIPELSKAYAVASISFGDRRRRDVHNYMPTAKAVVDGCTDAGVWRDDRDGILTGPDMRRNEIPGHIGLSLYIYEVVP